MTWVKLDDKFPEHPKVALAGPHAAWLYVAGLCWSARHLTDGRIPAAIVQCLTTIRKPKPEMLAERLVDVGLWEVADGGWVIHDFGSHQRSRSEVEVDRERTRSRVAKHRTKQSGNAVTSGVSNGAGNGDVRLLDTEGDTEPRSVGNSPRLPADDGPDRPTGAEQVIAAIAAKCGEPVLGAWAKQVQSAVLGRDPARFVAAVEQAPDGLRLPGLVQLVEQVGRRTGQPMDAVSHVQRVPEWAPDVTPIAADAAERARGIAAGLRGER